ncbi:hypothetical protein CH379_017935 [Leptospira ellisii]|uniref:Uncharacterized protein n=1 Tax=Leptospira ellisii TaxID=2023197 RepID=A0A2N0BGA6_9LEPT|nr:hypothetical protein [Leptospira ellisii]MDV6237516.1 hypothetical protein [Leptospira ellisii]PJZ91922.1 hypothetical protein CH379_16015 [Leptospira ellisii]PKA02928.1 hypothetical protein CH375_20035 [Leptospira ellisii]
MKNETISIQRGRVFQKFFPSKNLEGATVFCSFGTLKSDGYFWKCGQLESTILSNGYIIRMSEENTSKLSIGIFQFDILVERPDSFWPEGKNAHFEYFGILRVQ